MSEKKEGKGRNLSPLAMILLALYLFISILKSTIVIGTLNMIQLCNKATEIISSIKLALEIY